MKAEEIKVLLGVFNSDGACLSYFDLIEGVQNMSNEELDTQIKDSFQIFITYVYVPKKDEEIVCKLMFVYPKDEGKIYTTWGIDNKIMPYSQKSLFSIYKYSISKEIMETYEGE